MKQFISTKFFRTLQDASNSGVEIDADILKTGYEDFVLHLFSENDVSSGMADYQSALAYARVELSHLTEASGKKYGGICIQSH